MTRKSTGILAVMAVAIGLVGFGTTACGLDVPAGVQPPTDTTDTNPPVENIVPIDEAEVGPGDPGRR